MRTFAYRASFGSLFYDIEKMKNKLVFFVLLLGFSFYAKAVEPLDRGLKRTVFIPKGSWMAGGTVSYSQHEENNLNYLILKDVEGKGYNLSISPFGGYFFRDNVAAGLRFSYKRNFLELNDLKMRLGDDLKININDLYNLEHNYAASGFIRTYMSIGTSRIFGFFNDARLTYGYGSGKNSTGSGTDYDGTFQTIHDLQIGFAPGMCAFITNRSAIEVSFGAMGFNFKWIDQKINQIETGRRRVSSGNFKVNLFSINIGMTFFI